MEVSTEEMLGYYQWACGGDAWISSKTIIYALRGVDLLGTTPPSPPLDPSDFGRCLRILQRFHWLKPFLPMVAAKYPEWAGLVAHWNELEAEYMTADESGLGVAPEMYYRMKVLLREAGDCNS